MAMTVDRITVLSINVSSANITVGGSIMLDKYQPVEALINKIKGTTGALSGLLSRISGLVIFFVVLGVIASRIMLK